MRTVLLVAITLASALPSEAQQRLAPRAQAQPSDTRFQGVDRNNDGVITRDEWQGSLQSFRVHDWNNDGILSGDEMRPGARRPARDYANEDFDPAYADRYTDWTEAGFSRIDRNRDGRISSREWNYDNEGFQRADRNRDGALSRAEFLGEGIDDDREDRFDDLDVNRNGRIEESEWHASADAFVWLDRNSDGVLSRAEVVGNTRNRPNRFAGLDVDNDGVVRRDEWRWSDRSFDRVDTNGDGVLSRREVTNAQAVSATPAAPVATTGQSFNINAAQGWNDTRIDVVAGDRITIEADGTARLGDDPNDVATPAGSRTGRRAPNAPFPNEPAGALVARIGDGRVVFVGARRTFTAPNSGRLYLGLNDDHFADNSGEFQIIVNILPR